MLFKDLLKTLCTSKFYTIRIDKFDKELVRRVQENVYNMTEIPEDLYNSEVLTIQPKDVFNNKNYDYFVVIYK